MIGLLKWMERLAPADCHDLGNGAVIVRAPAARTVPAGCVALAADAAGHARRIPAGQRLDAGRHESVWCFHPGPYRMDLAPFAGAPELGLHLQVSVDEPDPRLRQQRFDLFVVAEAGEGLGAGALQVLLERLVRTALEQGTLELPPCTTLDEWNVFRAGLNQLVYTRFGLTVEDCFPVDLGEHVDYAAQLAARPQADTASARTDALKPTLDGTSPEGTLPAHDGAVATRPGPAQNGAAVKKTEPALSDVAPATGAPKLNGVAGTRTEPTLDSAEKSTGQVLAGAPTALPESVAGAAPGSEFDRGMPSPWRTRAAEALTALGSRGGASMRADAAELDAYVLRRLFLELPNVMCELRSAALPSGCEAFRAHQSLLARLDLVCLSVNTMPAFDLEGPGIALAGVERLRRADASAQALAALDETWSLLARIALAGGIDAAAADAADRIVANLEQAVENRRAVRLAAEEES